MQIQLQNVITRCGSIVDDLSQTSQPPNLVLGRPFNATQVGFHCMHARLATGAQAAAMHLQVYTADELVQALLDPDLDSSDTVLLDLTGPVESTLTDFGQSSMWGSTLMSWATDMNDNRLPCRMMLFCTQYCDLASQPS